MRGAIHRKVSERGGFSGGTTVHEAIESYLRYKINADGSKTTMRSPLREFADHRRDERDLEFVDELTPHDVRSYSEHLYDRVVIDENLAASTAHNYFAYVRPSFFSWSVREQHLESNPANTNTAMDPLPEDDGNASASTGAPRTARRYSSTPPSAWTWLSREPSGPM